MMLNRWHQMALLSLLLGVLVFVGGWWFGRGAQWSQRLQPSSQAEASLFDDPSGVPGTAIGQPQWLIIRDPAAFLPEPGPEGLRYVNDDYLRSKGVYPLQLKTVQFFRNSLSLGLLVLAGLLWWRASALLRRRDGSASPHRLRI